MRIRLTIAAAGIALATALAVALLVTRTAEPALAGVPTDTPTPTATPTSLAPTHYFTNGLAGAADALDVVSGGTIAVLVNPPGCGTPVVTPGEITSSVFLFTSFHTPVYGYYSITRVRWPTPCVDPGETVGVRFTPGFFENLGGLGVQSHVFLDSASATPTMTATPYAGTPTPYAGTPTPVPNQASFVLDCDPTAPGIQSSCVLAPGTTSVVVDVIIQNNYAAFQLGALGLTVDNQDLARLLATSPPCDVSGLNCNPDFDQVAAGGAGWACSPPPPQADWESGIPGQQTFFGCFNGAIDGVTIASGASVRIATITYAIPPGAPAGAVALSLKEGSIYDESFGERMSCYPTITAVGLCNGASITISDSPTQTPTNTPFPVPATPIPSSTPTGTATDVATATPDGPSVEKIPEGNANNADLSIPAANLWICETGPCAGPGEGTLRVVEHASGVVEGLGAYEFTVEYDNFVIQSVNPCDLVFGPSGAGSARGPVDELNASAINPDCAPDPNNPTNGTCAMSLVLENLVYFGCASSGQAAGPTGDFDLASLLLIPHPDLNNDLFPGNNNGVLTVLKDNGCELVDTLGHPVSGSVNGGLTPYCRDLAVTVRILEGDLDLDCNVDLTDAQAIASRYGAFFGGLLYSKWYDLEPEFHDLDIDIKDVQKIFGRQGSTCDTPIPAQPPLGPPTAFQD